MSISKFEKRILETIEKLESGNSTSNFKSRLNEGVDDPGILKCVFLAGGPGCFTEETLVKTQNGYKPIKLIQPGEFVWTINEDTREEELKPVIKNSEFLEHSEDLYELEFENNVIVKCTENHLFYVDGEWVKAKDLDCIKKTNLGKVSVPVYDLTVLDNHNYMVTDADIIVHNSGKSFTANDIFGVGAGLKGTAISGLKIVNSDSAFEIFLHKAGVNPKDLGKIEKNNPELWDKLTNDPNSPRELAKKLTQKQKDFYETGRLGMVIDGTGDNYAKIKKQKEHAETLGYDCYMVFVNTTLDVALERNAKRSRTLPEDLVKAIWTDVQSNLGSFQSLFGQNFIIVDNTVYKPIEPYIKKAIDAFLRRPIRNKIGLEWVKMQRALKKFGL